VSRLQEAVAALRMLSPDPNRYAMGINHRHKDKLVFPQRNEPLTDDILADHVLGRKTIAAVGADDTMRTNCVGVDIDMHRDGQNAREAARRFVQVCQVFDVPILAHRSRGGRGVHIRTLFEEPVPTYVGRALYVSMLTSAGLQANPGQEAWRDPAIDKVWPPPTGKNTLMLPYNSAWYKMTGGGAALDVNTLEPLPEGKQIECVLDAFKMQGEDEVVTRLQEWGVETDMELRQIGGLLPDYSVPGGERRQHYELGGHDEGVSDMVKSCVAVRTLVDNACTVSYEFWFSMATNFKPFKGGKEIFERISKLDPERFDQKALDSMWKAIRGGPRRCENLDPHGFACPARSVCRAASPAGLPAQLFRLRRRFE